MKSNPILRIKNMLYVYKEKITRTPIVIYLINVEASKKLQEQMDGGLHQHILNIKKYSHDNALLKFSFTTMSTCKIDQVVERIVS